MNKHGNTLSYPMQGDVNAPANKVYADFSNHVERFVSAYLSGYEPQHYPKSKVIHDCIWGTVMFYPWELQVIDSPLFQRLRRIKQVGLAVLTYPSAHHSRFEHTLGVTAVIAKMIASINGSGDTIWTGQSERRITDEDIFMLRMASLLHDVGHAFFSHSSEAIYRETPEFVELKNSFEIFKDAQAHEILSYMIINTQVFKTFFFEKIGYPFAATFAQCECLLADIGRMIIGAIIPPKETHNGCKVCKYYLTEMINGQFDADALDYLRRDSHATGLALTYHIDRFLYKLRLAEREEEFNGETVLARHITIPTSGISTIEEMMFSKLMLTRYIYQHQKVLAAGAVVSDIVEGLRYNNKLKHPADFLFYCDDDIYKLCAKGVDESLSLPIAAKPIRGDSSITLSDVAHNLLTRNLPKKAFIVNYANIAQIDTFERERCTIEDIMLKLRNIEDLRGEIFTEACSIIERLKMNCTIEPYDIHVIIPNTSNSKDYSDVYVLTSDDGFAPISEIVNLNELAGSFANHAWNAYVFARPDIVPIVSIAARTAIEKHGVFLNNKKVFSSLKEANEIKRLLENLGEEL